MQAKLYLFDLGKVLIDFDFAISINRLKKICAVDLLKVYSLFTNSSFAESWDKGLLSEEEFFETIKKELKLPILLEEFRPIWNEIFTEKKEMIDFARSLCAKNKVQIISNTNPWHVDYLRKNFSWLNQFHDFIASCEVQLLKPDPLIFQLALKRAQVQPSETVYIDDIPQNVDSARQCGIQSFCFKNYNTLMRDLLEEVSK